MIRGGREGSVGDGWRNPWGEGGIHGEREGTYGGRDLWGEGGNRGEREGSVGDGGRDPWGEGGIHGEKEGTYGGRDLWGEGGIRGGWMEGSVGRGRDLLEGGTNGEGERFMGEGGKL